MAVLAGFARGKRSQRSDRKAEIEADAVDMARADAGAGQQDAAPSTKVNSAASFAGNVSDLESSYYHLAVDTDEEHFHRRIP